MRFSVKGSFHPPLLSLKLEEGSRVQKCRWPLAAGNDPQLTAGKETEISVLQLQGLCSANSPNEQGSGSFFRAPRKEHGPSNTLLLAW